MAHMTTNYFRFLRRAAVLALCLAGAVTVQAQQRTGGTGGWRRRWFWRRQLAVALAPAVAHLPPAAPAAPRDYPNSTLPGDASFTYDPSTHSIIVLTDDKTFEQISQVTSNLDRPKPEVLIKVVFLEVQHDNALDFGVEGSYNPTIGSPIATSITTTILSNGLTALTTNFTTPNYNVGNSFGLSQLGSAGQLIGQTQMPTGAGIYSVMGSDYQATVRAIASAQKVEVLSRPSIMVLNNQPATITVGQSVPIVTGSTVVGTSGTLVNTITYQSVGIILQVTPFISADGLVEMIVAPQISSLSSQTVQTGSNVFSPVIDLRSASTVVVTPDGQTVIIGGLIENDHTTIDSKIPLLGDIPILGVLFKHQQKADTKKELLIFLTPHVVSMPQEMAKLTGAEDKGAIMSHKAFEEKELDRFFDRLPVKPVTPIPAGKKK